MSNLLQRALVESGAENDLSNLAQALADKYEDNLAAAKVNASYDLSRAAMNYYFRWKGDVMLLTFRLPEEWYYVEQGRQKTTGKTGKKWRDPVGDIMRWIDLKKLVPQPQMVSARVPRVKHSLTPEEAKRGMAHGILHKIHSRGFYTNGRMDMQPKGKHLLEKATEAMELRERLVGILTDALGHEIKVEMGSVINLHK